jgi:hypothetical protein
MSDTRKPAAKVSLYPVSAAIWRNQTSKGVFYSVTLERSYRDENGKLQSTHNLNASDMLLVAKLANEIDTEWRKLRAADRKAGQPEEEAA